MKRNGSQPEVAAEGFSFGLGKMSELAEAFEQALLKSPGKTSAVSQR